MSYKVFLDKTPILKQKIPTKQASLFSFRFRKILFKLKVPCTQDLVVNTIEVL